MSTDLREASRRAAEAGGSNCIVRPDATNGDKTYRVITDHLGSPIYVVNMADPSDVLLDATYDEWGQVVSYTSSTGAWPIPFGFAGGLYDEDTGLVRFGARDYDPSVGRWTAKDPIRWEGGQANLYVYVGNDPVTLRDPLGLQALLSCPAGAGACMDNRWVQGQVNLYERDRGFLGGLPIVAQVQMYDLHSAGADYDYWANGRYNKSYFEIRPGTWGNSADLGNFMAGYGAALDWLGLSLRLTHYFGGLYNAENDKAGMFGDSARSTYWIQEGYCFGSGDWEQCVCR